MFEATGAESLENTGLAGQAFEIRRIADVMYRFN